MGCVSVCLAGLVLLLLFLGLVLGRDGGVIIRRLRFPFGLSLCLAQRLLGLFRRHARRLAGCAYGLFLGFASSLPGFLFGGFLGLLLGLLDGVLAGLAVLGRSFGPGTSRGHCNLCRSSGHRLVRRSGLGGFLDAPHTGAKIGLARLGRLAIGGTATGGRRDALGGAAGAAAFR